MMRLLKKYDNYGEKGLISNGKDARESCQQFFVHWELVQIDGSVHVWFEGRGEFNKAIIRTIRVFSIDQKLFNAIWPTYWLSLRQI